MCLKKQGPNSGHRRDHLQFVCGLRGFDATVVPYLDKLKKSSRFTISKLIDRVHDRGVRDRQLTDGVSFEVSSVRVKFPAQFKLVSFN